MIRTEKNSQNQKQTGRQIDNHTDGKKDRQTNTQTDQYER